MKLTRSEEFRAVLREGVSVSSSSLKIAFRKAHAQRLGLVTSRGAGKAVVRNRMRRVIREHFRLHAPYYPQGDCVVIVRPALASFSNDDVRQEVERLLKRLRKTT